MQGILNRLYKFILITIIVFSMPKFAKAEDAKYKVSYGGEKIYNDDSNITGETGEGDTLSAADRSKYTSKEFLKKTPQEQIDEMTKNSNNRQSSFNQLDPNNQKKTNSTAQVSDNKSNYPQPVNKKEEISTDTNTVGQNSTDTKEIQEQRKQQLTISSMDVKMLQNGVMNSDAQAQKELKNRLSRSKQATLTQEQIDAFGIPSPIVTRDVNHKNHQPPPNIAMRNYNKQNRHLTKMIYPQDYEYNAFKIIQDDKNFSTKDFEGMVDVLQDPSILDNNGNTLLMHAIVRKKHQIVMHLINNGVQPNILNRFGISALHLSSYVGDHITTVALIESGADPNIRDLNGNTPLMYATLSGDPSLAKRIVDLGGDVAMRNLKGLDAMDFAYESGNLAMVNYLLKKGQTLLIHRDVLQRQSDDADYLGDQTHAKLLDDYVDYIKRVEYFYYAR
ncbi:ankyrin repeat domain-containing protein [Candidatus Deianiraea vastatrix]|uniref:Ankyrin repeats (3 copies) n=1 Tax=Candidatus Deianiraea vastatrix TaxID=2163644 RepID=A0A5B8XF32_9RICK|nr:ankyrin repeat domain-containing protein [Candidatus Deianiraea vastatrix]QED23870.1 Ankyrin repeats (3 copies) [Candidatus Deianiraea vastatrix]